MAEIDRSGIDPATSSVDQVNAFNRRVIEEFRANKGTVDGAFAGVPTLLLHTVGAKSGTARINPLAYQRLDNGYAIFASYAGRPKHPAWYHNLLAQPEVTIEVGTETVPTTARVAQGTERTTIWEKQKQDLPVFAEYEAKAGREIPVVVLEPTN